MSEQLLEQVKEAKKNSGQIDLIEQLLNKVTKEKQDLQKTIDDRNRAHEFYDNVFNSLTKIHSRRITDPRTKRFIGMKFKYITDGNGKSIYDYVEYNKDPFEQKLLENLEVKYDENDSKDGSWIDKTISITWLNTKY